MRECIEAVLMSDIQKLLDGTALGNAARQPKTFFFLHWN
jgi:hypothetical protein